MFSSYDFIQFLFLYSHKTFMNEFPKLQRSNSRKKQTPKKKKQNYRNESENKTL